MKLTLKQEEGLKIAVERYKNKEKYTCIAGFAGTGKSTLVKFIVAALDLPEDDVCYATFTGKAAQVLLKKGNRNVFTLHKLLYKSIPLKNGKFLKKPVDFVPYKVVIVDEVSMVPKHLIDLLFSYNIYVICLGDPFQLPPINKKEDNGLLSKPHVFLDEIMRQAMDSEIIRLSMDVRLGNKIEFSKGNEVIVDRKKTLNTGMLTWADEILVATNKTRLLINQQVRQLLGKGPMPEDGDKIICLKNYWEIFADNDDPLVNGTIGYLCNPIEKRVTLPLVGLETKRVDVLMANFRADNNAYFNWIDIDKNMILTGEKSCTWEDEYVLKRKKETADLVPLEFSYGYAITCHKAQGSEWDKVLVLEESFPHGEDHARWLYTAITRAASRLVLIR